MNAQEIDRKYPVRNPVWHFSDDTDCWYTEASMLERSGLFDPWSRPIPRIYTDACVSYDTFGDEIREYQYTTSVDNTQVELRVWND